MTMLKETTSSVYAEYANRFLSRTPLDTEANRQLIIDYLQWESEQAELADPERFIEELGQYKP